MKVYRNSIDKKNGKKHDTSRAFDKPRISRSLLFIPIFMQNYQYNDDLDYELLVIVYIAITEEKVKKT